MNREYDLIIYGASGFTGRLAVEYLDENYSDLNWAIAGRNEDKLVNISNNSKCKPDYFIADSEDSENLLKIASKTRVIASLAGPFNKYSDNLVAQCVEAGTHYLDITGENIWVRDLIDKHHEEAEKKQIKIIPSCGYDSIPSDMGCFYLQRSLNQELQRIDGYHRGNGGVSGGTIESAFSMRNYKSKYSMGHPFLLNSKEYIKTQNISENKDNFKIKYINDIELWSAPFVMAIANTRVVRRSSEIHDKNQASYGSEFKYQEYMMLKKYSSAFLVTAGLAVFGLMLISPISGLFRKLFTKAGNGPDKKTRENGWFESIFIGKSKNNEKYKLRMFCKGDPGYKSTAKLICESALCLALNRENLPNTNAGGVLTTSTGLGLTLIDRLKNADVLFDGPSKI